MMKEKFLPLGTVVLLKNGTKRLSIIGYAGISNETGDKMFDYIGCLYPEGMINSNKNLLFDHSQIEKVIFEGYSDDEDKVFKEKLNIIINNYHLEHGDETTSQSEIETLPI